MCTHITLSYISIPSCAHILCFIFCTTVTHFQKHVTMCRHFWGPPTAQGPGRADGGRPLSCRSASISTPAPDLTAGAPRPPRPSVNTLNAPSPRSSSERPSPSKPRHWAPLSTRASHREAPRGECAAQLREGESSPRGPRTRVPPGRLGGVGFPAHRCFRPSFLEWSPPSPGSQGAGRWNPPIPL